MKRTLIQLGRLEVTLKPRSGPRCFMLEENFRFRDNLLFWAVQLKNFLTNKRTWCWAAAGWLLLPQPLAIAHAQPPPHKDTRPAYLKLVVSDAQPLPTPSLPQLEEIPVPAPEPPPAPPPAPIQSYSGTGDSYLDWIIQHESGGNPYAVNSIGACGLGQALPCSKMGCDLSDVACQIAWVRSYCISTYGSTYNAYLFWVAHNWY